MGGSNAGDNLSDLRIGERVSLLLSTGGESLGFVTATTPSTLRIITRRGVERVIERSDIAGGRRVGVALGRDPAKTPKDLLDALAERADVSGQPWVCRISSLLAGRTPPSEVPTWGEWASIGGVRARFEGAWVTLADGTPEVWVASAWWGTRMGARSVQVRTDDPAVEEVLSSEGFQKLF